MVCILSTFLFFSQFFTKLQIIEIAISKWSGLMNPMLSYPNLYGLWQIYSLTNLYKIFISGIYQLILNISDIL